MLDQFQNLEEGRNDFGMVALGRYKETAGKKLQASGELWLSLVEVSSSCVAPVHPFDHVPWACPSLPTLKDLVVSLTFCTKRQTVAICG